MNDLAEKALQGLDVARRWVRDHPMLCFAAGGFVVSVVVVLAGADVGPGASTRAVSSWLGIEDTRDGAAGDALPGSLMLAGVALLLLLWIGATEVIRRTRPPETRVWWVAMAWAAPFLLGPPLMDTSVYSYVAYGRLQRGGGDPYRSGPVALGGSAIVNAITPGGRGTPSSAGPLGTLLQHLSVSVSGGALLGAVLVMRAITVLGAIMIGRLVVRIGDVESGTALALCVLNPLVLLYAVSSPHLEVVTAALVLGALAALVTVTRRRWPAAIALACLAGSVTGQAFVALPVLFAAHWVGAPTGRPGDPTVRPPLRWRVIGADVLVAAVTIAAAGFVVPHGFRWASTVRRQFAQHTPFAVSDAISRLLAPIVRDASYDDLAAGGRITVLAAAAFAVTYLVVTVRQRPVAASVGYALLALALLAPVLHPWYFVWGLVPLAATLTDARRVWLLALSAAASLLDPIGFPETTTRAVTGAGLAIVALVLGAVLVARQRGWPAALGTISALARRFGRRAPERS